MDPKGYNCSGSGKQQAVASLHDRPRQSRSDAHELGILKQTHTTCFEDCLFAVVVSALSSTRRLAGTSGRDSGSDR